MTRHPSILLLGLLTALDAMAIDIYVPALPSIQADFAVSASAAQSTLSIFFLGVAGGQAVWGPISDYFGRRVPLLIGLVVYVAGSIVAAYAPSFPVLAGGRFLQAVGASAGLVIPRAIVADIWSREAAAKVYSTLMLILGVTAIIAPVIGGGVLAFGSWRAIFWVLAVIGVIGLSWSMVTLPESLPKILRRNAAPKELLADYAGLFRNVGFLWAATASAFAMATMFAILSASTFLFIRQFGWTTTEFTMMYAMSSVIFVLVCQANTMALRKYSAEKLLQAGLKGQLLLATITLVMGSSGLASPLVLATLVILMIGILGIILGNSVSEAMGRATAGTVGAASSVIGVGQFLLSAAVTPLATAMDNIMVSMGIVSAFCAMMAWYASAKARSAPVSAEA